MKRLILAVLVTVAATVPNAEARYSGQIRAGNYNLIVAPQVPPGNCSATGILITKSGNMKVDYAITTTGTEESHTIPKDVSRLVILGDAPSTGGCMVQINQGDDFLDKANFQQEQRFVFDVY